MKTPIQKDFVISQLKRTGEVSRNSCLERRITRLGAIICDLNKEGWVITGAFRKYTNQIGKPSKDFVYTLISEPPLNSYQKMHLAYQSGELAHPKLII